MAGGEEGCPGGLCEQGWPPTSGEMGPPVGADGTGEGEPGACFDVALKIGAALL